ncbi:hypothetical protein [Bdellovibrio svalbardensis]|uniref:Integral membrane protein n=1 Tax=Bdellovibrio svalbardensis TaxID=2972972 RepID=A0ABT6DLK5_9BACT|nr:hypothetical protein [Bdellovibrio svalbardensis]MDG0816691.1 hypothetical protein [Bdellovibrio svalbardensis]
MHFNKSLFKFAFESVLLLLVFSAILFIIGFILNLLSRKSREVVTSATNPKTFLYLFFPGIMIHELSHMVAALVFLHKIERFKLIDFAAKNGSHGHVITSRRNVWNLLYVPQLWQSMGSLFIGIAPLVVGPLAMLIWFKYFVPGGRSFLLHPSLQSLPMMSLHLGIWLYVAFATLSNIELSDADLSEAWKGFGFVLLFVFVLALASGQFHPTLITSGLLHKYWSMMGVGALRLKILSHL